MKPEARLRLATDVPAYADHIRRTMDHHTQRFEKKRDECHPPCIGLPSYRTLTLYEKKAAEKSDPSLLIHEFEFVRRHE